MLPQTSRSSQVSSEFTAKMPKSPHPPAQSLAHSRWAGEICPVCGWMTASPGILELSPHPFFSQAPLRSVIAASLALMPPLPTAPSPFQPPRPFLLPLPLPLSPADSLLADSPHLHSLLLPPPLPPSLHLTTSGLMQSLFNILAFFFLSTPFSIQIFIFFFKR